MFPSDNACYELCNTLSWVLTCTKRGFVADYETRPNAANHKHLVLISLTYSPTLLNSAQFPWRRVNQVDLSAPEISFKSIASHGPPVLILPRMWFHYLTKRRYAKQFAVISDLSGTAQNRVLCNISRILRYCKFPSFLAVKVTAAIRLENALCNISLPYLINVVKWGQRELIYIRLPNRKILNDALDLFVMKMLLFY